MTSARQPVAAREGEGLRAYFLGVWHLARTIEDRRDRRHGFLRGRAEFAPDGRDLRYGEAGRLRLGVYTGAVEQHYRYAFSRPDHATVRFADGRPFFDLELSQGRGTFLHRCGADIYRGAIEIYDSACFAMFWRVSGPRKDYVLRSRYRRRLATEWVRPLQGAAACRIEWPVRGSARVPEQKGT